MDRVVVTGAGNDGVNGLYRKNRNAVEGEPMYSKNSERAGGQFCMFFWGDMWQLAPQSDLSNVSYSCAGTMEKVPSDGWTVAPNGQEPPPRTRTIPGINVADYKSIRSSLPACFNSYSDLLGN